MENELTTEEGMKLLDSVASLGGKMFVLSGGEPLLRRDLFKLSSYGASLGLKMLLATNGTLISSYVARKIVDSGVKVVAISLDGAKPETHDSFRGVPGVFKSTLKGIKECIKAGLDVQINVTVTKLNYGEVPEILIMAEKLGAKYVHVFHFVPTGRGTVSSEMEVSVNEYKNLLNNVYRLQKHLNLLIKPTCAPQYWAYLAKEGNPFTSKFLKVYPRGCIAGASYAYINPLGEVTPCPYLPVTVGNVREKSFSDIWRNSTILRELRDRNNLKGRCCECMYREICGGCRARSYAHYKDYLESDPACTFTC